MKDTALTLTSVFDQVSNKFPGPYALEKATPELKQKIVDAFLVSKPFLSAKVMSLAYSISPSLISDLAGCRDDKSYRDALESLYDLAMPHLSFFYNMYKQINTEAA